MRWTPCDGFVPDDGIIAVYKNDLLQTQQIVFYVDWIYSAACFSLGMRMFSRMATMAAGTMPEPPKISWMA